MDVIAFLMDNKFKMKRGCFSIAVAFLSIFCGCNRETGQTVIVCDTVNAAVISLSGSPVFEETVLSPSPLKSPQHVEIPGDGSVFFYCLDSLYRYSLKDGHREVTYGHRGRAGNEYVQMWEYWLDGSEVCLYDLDGGKVLRFSRDGQVFGKKELRRGEYPFQLLCRLDRNHWVGRLNFRGEQEVTPELGLYDNEMEFVRNLSAATLRSGLRIGYPFSRNKAGVLYCGPLSDKIIQVTTDSSYVRFQVEFTDGTVKLDNYKDEYEALSKIIGDQSKKDFSYSISYVQEEGDYVGFMYISSKRGPMYALYNTRSEETRVFNIKLKDGFVLSAVIIQNGKIYFVGFGDDDGTRVWQTEIKTFLSM